MSRRPCISGFLFLKMAVRAYFYDTGSNIDFISAFRHKLFGLSEAFHNLQLNNIGGNYGQVDSETLIESLVLFSLLGHVSSHSCCFVIIHCDNGLGDAFEITFIPCPCSFFLSYSEVRRTYIVP